MPVSGLVVLCPDRNEEAIRLIRDNARFTIGPDETPGRLPVVLETETHRQHRAELKWLQQLPGVGHVELAYADYRELEPEPASPDPAKKEQTQDVR